MDPGVDCPATVGKSHSAPRMDHGITRNRTISHIHQPGRNHNSRGMGSIIKIHFSIGMTYYFPSCDKGIGTADKKRPALYNYIFKMGIIS